MLRQVAVRPSSKGSENWAGFPAAVLGSRAFPLPPKGQHELEEAAKTLGLQLQHHELASADDLDRTFADMARVRIGGLLVRSDPFVLEPNAKRVVALALKHRLPAVYWLYTYPQAGGFMSYSADVSDVHRRSAFYVDRLLHGARPDDLPVEEPSTLTLVETVKTAQAIGINLPPSILGRADEVIQ
jgi:putative ABC transport system substrate-binding protein